MAAMDEGKMDVVVQVKREQGKKDDPLKMHTDLPASMTSTATGTNRPGYFAFIAFCVTFFFENAKI